MSILLKENWCGEKKKKTFESEVGFKLSFDASLKTIELLTFLVVINIAQPPTV